VPSPATFRAAVTPPVRAGRPVTSAEDAFPRPGWSRRGACCPSPLVFQGPLHPSPPLCPRSDFERLRKISVQGSPRAVPPPSERGTRWWDLGRPPGGLGGSRGTPPSGGRSRPYDPADWPFRLPPLPDGRTRTGGRGSPPPRPAWPSETHTNPAAPRPRATRRKLTTSFAFARCTRPADCGWPWVRGPARWGPSRPPSPTRPAPLTTGGPAPRCCSRARAAGVVPAHLTAFCPGHLPLGQPGPPAWDVGVKPANPPASLLCASPVRPCVHLPVTFHWRVSPAPCHQPPRGPCQVPHPRVPARSAAPGRRPWGNLALLCAFHHLNRGTQWAGVLA